MSQRDVVAELRSARAGAPAELRERIRLIAAEAPPDRRRITLRRTLLVLVPVAAAIAAAIVVTRPSGTNHTAVPQTLEAQVQHGAAAAPDASSAQGAFKRAAATPFAPSTTRPQKYSASLTLRVATPVAVSDAAKRAVAIAASLGGYVVSAHVDAGAKSASADLVVKVPKGNVRTAIARLSQLGTITGEQVDIQDLQVAVAGADRTIARLQRQLAALRAEQPTDAVTRQIAALTARIQRLQRAEAATLRAARYATVDLHVATPPTPAPHRHGHGPLHGLGVAFRWIGIGAVYALALGVPAVVLIGLGWLAVRTVRRRREDALLNRP